MMSKFSDNGLLRWVLIGVLAVALNGCVSVDPEFADARDPWEGFNRASFQFNETLDQYLAAPVARGYDAIMPNFMNKGVSNFFGNLDDVGTSANNLLQGKFGFAVSDVGRVLVNSTVGLAGLVDIASSLNLEKHHEDFGQTLGYWGLGPGPYLVLPVFGPRTVRDTAGLAVDWYVTDPVFYVDSATVRWSVFAMRFIDTRAGLLGASDVLASAALEPYSFVRNAYLQRRLNLIYDGSPPLEDFFDDEF